MSCCVAFLTGDLRFLTGDLRALAGDFFAAAGVKVVGGPAAGGCGTFKDLCPSEPPKALLDETEGSSLILWRFWLDGPVDSSSLRAFEGSDGGLSVMERQT